MKKIIAKIVLILFISVTLSAANNPKELFLWKTTIGKSSVYLLGTVHVAPKSIYPLHKKIMRAFNKARIFVCETYVPKEKEMKLARLFLQKNMLPKNKTLKQILSPQLWQKLEKKCSQLGVQSAFLNNLHPMMVGITLQMLAYKQIGHIEKYGIDSVLTKLAEKNKKIIALEKATFQIELLSNFSLKAGTASLKNILNNWPTEKQMQYTIKIWQNGNKRQAHEMIFKYIHERGAKTFYKKMIFDRNKKMTQKIIRLAQQKPNSYFVAVGTGHLIGPQNIIMLLRKKGYTVTRIIQ